MSRKKKYGMGPSDKRRFAAQASRKGRHARKMSESEMRALAAMFSEIGHVNRAIEDARESDGRRDDDHWFDDDRRLRPRKRR